ncbi:right-handed parallel beta-helix repeat-containing protein [Candidatus Neomarinimicrobiota bacterium]
MKKVNIFSVLIACIFLVSGALATTYYVSEFGDDTTGDGSSTAPWATIQKAADAAVAGDIIMVQFGEYAETVVPKTNGTDGSPIVFQSEEAGEAIISTGPAFTDALAYTQHADSIWVAADVYREVTSVFVDGSALLGKDHVDSLTAGSWFQDRGEANLYLIVADKDDPGTHTDSVNYTERSFDIVDGSYLTIDGFTIKGTIDAQVADDDVDLPGLVITNNVFAFDDTSELAIEINGGSADTVKTYEDFLIDNNVFEYNSGIRLGNCGRNSVVSDNTFNGIPKDIWGGKRNAMYVYGDGDVPGSGKQSTGLVIERNFSNNTNDRHFYFRYNIDGVTFRNNILYRGGSAGLYMRDYCTNFVVANNTFYWNAASDHLSKIYHGCSVILMNNIFAYPQRAYTWFHDNKGDTTAAVRLPFEIDYNYFVTDTSLMSDRDDELIRMRTLADGFYIYGEDLGRHTTVAGGEHAVYGHPMVLRTSITQSNPELGEFVVADGDTVTVDSIGYHPSGLPAFVREYIPDMWFQDAYPLFADAGPEGIDDAAAAPENFMLLEGSNAIGAANPDVAPDLDFFGLQRDENPDIGAIEFEGIPVSVKDLTDKLFPENYALSQNYPNPFNPVTTIKYTMREAGFVKLTVYNLLGQEVIRLVDGVRRNGPHTVTWNSQDKLGNSVPTGIYFCRMEAGSYTKTMKMLLLK